LAPVDKLHVVQARWLAQARLSALPLEALKLYRSRIDPPAKKLLDQARTQRDPVLLRRIVDEWFCSSFTDQALDLLGDLAFERGDFEEAEQLWRMIVRPASQSTMQIIGLTITDPKIDVAAIRAKQILAEIFRGDAANLLAELQAFASAHPEARGRLAGKQGIYVDLLKALMASPKELGAPPGMAGWPQFAGDAERNRVLPRVDGRLARIPCPEGPAWQVRLEDKQRLVRPLDGPPTDKILSWTEAGRLLGYYPAIAGDRVVVANAYHVTAYQLSTGAAVFNYNHRENQSKTKTLDADLSCPVTVVGDHIFARLGTKATGPQRNRGRRGFRPFNNADFQNVPIPDTALVCLTMQPNLGQVQWIKEPPSAAEQGANVAFEGAPLVHQNRAYAAVTQFLAGQTRSLLVCYDAGSGNLRWQKEVCMTAEAKEGETRIRHHLLTLAGPNIVYCSHSGAVVAVDALTGQIRWGVRYPSRGPKTNDGQPSLRSLAPCCYADGRVYAAPLDHDRVLCLDSRTGQTIWESEPMEVVHLLGVAHGKLFCTTLTPRRGLRSMNAATGDARGAWMQPGDDSDLPTFGRGLLADNLVFWPTRDGLHVLRQSDGEPVAFDPEIRGNLAAADGCLISADARVLSAYLPDKWSLRRRAQEAAQVGASPNTFYRLGLAELDAGLIDQARISLEKAWKEADTPHLREQAQAKVHEILRQSAQAAADRHDWQAVESNLTYAAFGAFPARDRLAALALRAQLAQASNRLDQAVAAWQSVLDTPELAVALIEDSTPIPASGKRVAFGQINRLIKEHGRDIYQTIEKRAVELAKTGNGMGLAHLERRYPHALITMRSLEARAAQAAKEQKPWEAADLYRRLLDIAGTPLNRIQVLANLALAYEQQNCFEAARGVLDQMQKEGGDRHEAAIDPALSVRMWAQQRRRQLSAAQGRAKRQDDFFRRQWQTSDAGNGLSQLSESRALLFRASDQHLDCLSVATGKVLWKRTLPYKAHWLGLAGDQLVLASAQDLLCVRQGDGVLTWEESFPQSQSTSLSNFQIASGNLYFLFGTNCICAWDVSRGRNIWCEWAPGSRLHLSAPDGCFAPKVVVAGATCLLSTGVGRPLLYDSRTGTRLYPEWGASRKAWPAPVEDDSPWGFVFERENLRAVRLSSGEPTWEFRFEAPHSLTGERPELRFQRDHLLVQIPYNFGYLLEHLDPQTGKRLWPQAVFVGAHPLDLRLGDMDDKAVYCSSRDGTEARSLSDGTILWRKSSGAQLEPKRILRSDSILLSSPATGPRTGWELAWIGRAIRWPTAGLQSSADYNRVEILDPKTGQLLQSLNLAIPEPELAKVAVRHSPFSLFPSARALRQSATELRMGSENLLVMQGLAATAYHAISEIGGESTSGNP
jgi:outer membrane protein assembly factor BamB